MRGTNINTVLRMVRRYLKGKTDTDAFCRDFPDEVVCRYRKMAEEDQKDARIILYWLVENGTDCRKKLSEEDFRSLIQKQYDNIMDGVYL